MMCFGLFFLDINTKTEHEQCGQTLILSLEYNYYNYNRHEKLLY